MFFLLLIFFSSSQISLNSEEILSIDPAFKRDMIVAGHDYAIRGLVYRDSDIKNPVCQYSECEDRKLLVVFRERGYENKTYYFETLPALQWNACKIISVNQVQKNVKFKIKCEVLKVNKFNSETVVKIYNIETQ